MLIWDTMNFYFYPRPPRGGRRIAMSDLNLRIAISIHALREEGDPLPCCRGFMLPDFYPRPPRGGRPAQSLRRRRPSRISIHALREEGDLRGCTRNGHLFHFYPRPPRGGRRTMLAFRILTAYFYPRPPRGGRPSTRTLQRESHQFLSTPSARRATNCAPRLCRPSRYFYPRPPRGGRRAQRDVYKELCIFLSTPSARRATPHQAEMQNHRGISIHALREEGDALCPAAS